MCGVVCARVQLWRISPGNYDAYSWSVLYSVQCLYSAVYYCSILGGGAGRGGREETYNVAPVLCTQQQPPHTASQHSEGYIANIRTNTGTRSWHYRDPGPSLQPATVRQWPVTSQNPASSENSL